MSRAQGADDRTCSVGMKLDDLLEAAEEVATKSRFGNASGAPFWRCWTNRVSGVLGRHLCAGEKEAKRSGSPNEQGKGSR